MAISFAEGTAGSFPYRLDLLKDLVVQVRNDWRTSGTYHALYALISDSLAGGDITPSGDIQDERDIQQKVWDIFDEAVVAMTRMNRRLKEEVAIPLMLRHVHRDTSLFQGPEGRAPAGVPTTQYGNFQTFSPTAAQVLRAAQQELRRQMAVADTVKTCTVTATGAAGSANTGNGVFLATTLRGDGSNNPHLPDAKGRLTCIKSFHDDPSYRRHEEFLYEESDGPQDPCHPDWWEGSRGIGARKVFRIVDPTAMSDRPEGRRGNLLRNGFETFDAAGHTPLYWNVGTGTAGTDFSSTTTSYFGSKALKFIAGTATAAELRQPFNSQANSPSEWKGQRTYGRLVRLRASGTITAGVLQIYLAANGAAKGTALTDDAGASLMEEITLSAIGSGSWTDKTYTYCSPKGIGKDAEVRIGIKTGSLLTGADLYVDSFALTDMQPPYPGGIPFCGFAGSTDFQSASGGNLADYLDWTLTNNFGGQTHARATLQLFALAFLDLARHNVAWPESGTPTLPD